MNVRCEWFVRCTNEAAAVVPHPAFSQGVPACQRCIDKFELVGQPLSHWEDWTKLLWNAALGAIDEEAGGAQALSPEHPLYGLLETMHGIAEGQPRFTGKGGLLAELA